MLDHPATLRFTRTKPLALKSLSDHDIAIPPYCEYNLNETQSAHDFLHRHGVCVVKPADGAGGDGVTTNVRTSRDLNLSSIFASYFCNQLLIEKQVTGESYRLLYLDGKLIDAIWRRSPSVMGDGKSTIRELIRQENQRRVEAAGKEGLTGLSIDADCRSTLRKQELKLGDVPNEGVKVMVKQGSNNNSTRENESVLPLICDEVVEEGARAAEILGVQLAGVDIMTPDPSRSLHDAEGAIHEVNVCPGLHFHYMVCNPHQAVDVAVPILKRLLGLDMLDRK
jgi:cyanophycin synthetase